MECCKNNHIKKKNKIEYFLRFINKKEKNKKVNYNQQTVLLVGSPNVGKSSLFNELTGAYVEVSNYPGTSVDISKGHYISGEQKFEIIDTPGVYSLNPITEEEAVTREFILKYKSDIVLHVVDAKNLSRMLPLTLQMIECGLNVVLVLNIIDEANKLGIQISERVLKDELGINVVKTSATSGVGINKLKNIIKQKFMKVA